MAADGKNTHIRKRGLRQRGQALVEFAFVVPIFLMLLLGIVDFGMAFKAWISITNAAREGARIGAVHADCAAVVDRTVETSADLLTPADVTVDNCEGDPGESVVVTVAYDYEYITPLGAFVEGLSGGPLHMEASADMRLE
jgi:hypothetical protein